MFWSARARGTSPRAWGKQDRMLEARQVPRNIPTGVGKTHAVCAVVAACPEHPHGRGENSSRTASRGTIRGTSPRAWGKLDIAWSTFVDLWNIPTGVGKTSAVFLPSALFTEHPHGRGENCRRAHSQQPRDGTSPRAWGKRCRRQRSRPSQRNIPTGVGKTSNPPPPPPPSASEISEHPHGRGENYVSCLTYNVNRGTSPRAWGKRTTSKLST